MSAISPKKRAGRRGTYGDALKKFRHTRKGGLCGGTRRAVYYTFNMVRHFVAAILFVLFSHAVLAQTKPSPAESEIRDTLANFIHAFDNLDWETFRLSFSDNATVFYPRGFPERANGRAEFEKRFKVVFDEIRGSKTRAPYMDIQPRDMNVRLFGNVAIVTFHLDDRAGFLNRRTIVLNKTEAGWKIVHLHASEVSVKRANP